MRGEKGEGAGLNFPRIGPMHSEVILWLFFINFPSDVNSAYPPLGTIVAKRSFRRLIECVEKENCINYSFVDLETARYRNRL